MRSLIILYWFLIMYLCNSDSNVSNLTQIHFHHLRSDLRVLLNWGRRRAIDDKKYHANATSSMQSHSHQSSINISTTATAVASGPTNFVLGVHVACTGNHALAMHRGVHRPSCVHHASAIVHHASCIDRACIGHRASASYHIVGRSHGSSAITYLEIRDQCCCVCGAVFARCGT